MRPNAEQPSGRSPSFSGFDALSFVARVLEASVVVFTRSRFGARYFGIEGLGVFLWAMVFIAYWGDQSVTAPTTEQFSWIGESYASPRYATPSADGMLGFLGVWFLAFFVARADILKRRLKGDPEHTRYSGLPHRLFRAGLSERSAKISLEPVLVFVAGALLQEWDPLVGTFVMFGAAGILVSSAINLIHENRRLEDMRDAQIEQRHLAARFRGKRWM